MANEGGPEERHPSYESGDGRENVTVRRVSRADLLERIEELEEVVANLNTVLETSRQSQDRMDRELQFLRDLVTSGILAAGNGGGNGGGSTAHVKVKTREPETYNGVRDDKVLGNFFFDMEEYLQNIPGLTDEAQVRTAVRYLEGNAKLWWRTRMDDRAAGRDVVEVDNWDQLKRALSDQFLPGNSAWRARKQLRELRQTGRVSDYVKAFSSLMLEIKDMSEEDRLFCFMEGLQPWAWSELQRLHVKTLAEAVREADRLLDFRLEKSSRLPASPPKVRDQNKGKQPYRPPPARSNNSSKQRGGSRHRPSRQRKQGYLGSSSSDGSYQGGKERGGYRGGHRAEKRPRRQNSSPKHNRTVRCFLCQKEDHVVRDCPLRPQVNALQVDDGQTLGGLPLLNCRKEDLTPEQIEFISKFGKLMNDPRTHGVKVPAQFEVGGPSNDKAVGGLEANKGVFVADKGKSVVSSDEEAERNTARSSGSRSPKPHPPRRKVDKVLASNGYTDFDGRQRRIFRVQWKGGDRTWEPAENLIEFEDQVQDFIWSVQRKHLKKQARRQV